MAEKRLSTPLIVLLVLVLSLALASTVFAAAYGVPLTGEEEVPGPGDPDGSGRVRIRLNVAQAKVCWILSVEDIAPATAAHIHVGAEGVAGPVVVALSPPTSGSSSGCAFDVDRGLIRAITHHPEEYYVNVHNADYPAGAVRGQLDN